jgi:multidrug transporter EmrE-like cation transporter
MMPTLTAYLYVALTVLLIVFGQIVIKWQVLEAGALPPEALGRVAFIAKLLGNLWVIGALAAALAASVCWMLAMTKLPLSHAYPFVSLSFVLVLILSAIFFGEPLSWPKALGVALIVAGVAVGSQG